MLTVLDPFDDTQPFPDIETALEAPDGLLAVGGCLSPRRLENAYRHGIFPWYNENEPILWWSPNPRMILMLNNFKISRSLGKMIRRDDFQISFDKAFKEVVEACAGPRSCTNGTWINQEMKQAYWKMHEIGLAHSVETWYQNQLVGGLYGIAIGQVFFGESMFYRRSNASKIALSGLVKIMKSWGYVLIDCQIQTQHLMSLGAEEIPRQQFVQLLAIYCNHDPLTLAWKSVTT